MGSFLVATWGLTLGKYLRSQDVIFGLVVSGRESNLSNVERLVGNLISTMPIRFSCKPKALFRELIAQIQTGYISSLPYCQTGLLELHRICELPPQTKLFNTTVAVQNFPAATRPDFVSEEGSFSGDDADGIMVNFEVLSGSVKGSITFKSEDLSPLMAKKVVGTMGDILDRLCRSALIDSCTLENLTSLNHSEISEVLQAASSPHVSVENNFKLIHHGFESMAVKLSDDAVAVESGSGNTKRTISYKTLDVMSNIAANRLRNAGIGAGSVVAVVTGRSIEMVVAIIGALKASATYVPVDPTFPVDRIDTMLAESKCNALLFSVTTASLAIKRPQIVLNVTDLLLTPLSQLDEAEKIKPIDEADERTTAFIVFTSGSTGIPKGVKVHHGGIARLFNEPLKMSSFTPGVRSAQFLNIGFDAAQGEVFFALAGGATIVLRGNLKENDNTFDILKAVDVLHITPTGLSQLDPDDFANLKRIFVGAEPLTRALAKKWAGNVQLVNLYGPTETSCFVSGTVVNAENSCITIGRPLVGSNLFVLDDLLLPVPVGVRGKLFIAGPCVTNGYLNSASEQSRSFVKCHLGEIGVLDLYATGDEVRFLPNYELQIFGRSDSQIKLRGYRIELEEVSAAINSNPFVSIGTSLVIDKKLVGFVSPANISTQMLQDAMMKKLPTYMVPAVFIKLDNFPVNANGKVDKLKLKTLYESQSAETELSFAKLTHSETLLVEIWQALLKAAVGTIHSESSFFECGGDSLSVIKMCNQARATGFNFAVADVFVTPWLKTLASMRPASFVKAELKKIFVSPQIVEEIKESVSFSPVDIYPCTPLQEAMLVKSLDVQTAYVHQVQIHSKFLFNFSKLSRAFQAVIDRNDILRTSFVATSSGFYQVLRSTSEIIFLAEEEANLEEFLAADYKRGFDLKSIFFRLTNLRNLECAVFTIHHALYDGWSLSLILQDLISEYDGYVLPATIPFRMFIDFTENMNRNQNFSYWKEYLSGIEPQDSFTLGVIENSSGKNFANLNRKLSLSQIDACARFADVTTASVLKAGWALTLRKYSRQNEVIFGQVLASRDIPLSEAEFLVGPTVNTVPCRVFANDEDRAIDLLKCLSKDHGQMLPNSHLGLSEIQKLTNVAGDQKLFNTLFVFEKLPLPPTSKCEDSLTFSHIAAPDSASDSGLFELVLFPEGNELEVSAKFDSATISATQSLEVLEEFEFTLQRLVDAVFENAKVGSLWELSQTQLQSIEKFSFGPVIPLQNRLVHQSFESIVKRLPNSPALEMGNTRFTYAELDCATYTLAKMLVDLGVQGGSVVAVIGVSSIEFVVSVVAVARMGCVLVPIDSKHPLDRIEFNLKDSGATFILTNEEDFAELQSLPAEMCKIFAVDASALSRVVASSRKLFYVPEPTDTFMIIYTSGSTGRPKGVNVSHQGISNVAINVCASIGIVEGARVLQSCAVGFDAAAQEIWGSLSNGACLVIRGEDILKTVNSVSVILQTPTFLNKYLGNPEMNPQLKVIVAGGEFFPKELRDRWSTSASLINAFGPTEISIMSHYATIAPSQSINIGHVIPNACCHVLDANARQVPTGVIGELYLGGIGVANGYKNLPELTQERFVQNPFDPARKLFKSGDMGRFLSNGCFEVTGRKDNMVKLRGYRIELDEIRSVILTHSAVTDAVVFIKDKSFIVAFVTPSNLNVNEVRDFAALKLPQYMVPAVVIPLSSIPMTVNGKADILSLGKMDIKIEVSRTLTELESKLAEIWSDILGVSLSEIRSDTSFFALGGDSISAIRLVSRARQIGLDFTSSQLFKTPTLTGLVFVASKTTQSNQDAEDTALVEGFSTLSPIQRKFFDHQWANVNHFNQSISIKLRQSILLSQLIAAFNSVLKHHDVLRSKFENLDGKWTQQISPDCVVYAEHVICKNMEEYMVCAKLADESLSLASGKLHMLLLAKFPDGLQRLYISIHHLVVDVVSWTIILEDLETCIANGRLPSKTISFPQWTESLIQHTTEYDEKKWTEYYTDGTNILQAIGKRDGNKRFLEKTISFNSDCDLNSANSRYGTNSQELVLAALCLALSDISEYSAFQMDIEGHGRHPWSDDLDISRTVGWFTCVYPVVLPCRKEMSIRDVIKSVKQILRDVPDKGLSFAALKYLGHAFEIDENPRIAFNYIPKFKPNSNKSLLQSDAEANFDFSISPENSLFCPVNIVCLNTEMGNLQLQCSFEDGWISAHFLELWLEKWVMKVQDIMKHCNEPHVASINTAPLLPSVKCFFEVETALHQRNLLKETVDIYPATALQQIFLLGLMQGQSEYTNSFIFDLKGEIDISRFKYAWNQVVLTHDILRTVFVSTTSGIMQAVLKSDNTDWVELIPWKDSEVDILTTKQKNVELERNFSMHSNSFFRISYAKINDTSNNHIRVFLTSHHSVVDGWSMGIIMSDLRMACEGACLIKPAASFHQFIEFVLTKSTQETEIFWKSSLNGFDDLESLTSMSEKHLFKNVGEHGTKNLVLSLASYKRMLPPNVTMSTFCRVAWALTLKFFTRSDKVVFGSVVSGRDSNLNGLESVAGVMINTIPVPVDLSPHKTLSTILQEVQAFGVESINYSFSSLTDIQKWSGISKLFETLFVFQNLPNFDSNPLSNFSMTTIESEEQTNMPLSVKMYPDGQDKFGLNASFLRKDFCDFDVESLLTTFSKFTEFMFETKNLQYTIQEVNKKISPATESSLQTPQSYNLIHHAFENAAQHNPDMLAVEFAHNIISYRDLDIKSNVVANRLRNAGIGAGSVVAVVTGRSIEMVVAIIGALKASATYVPVDPTFPVDRIDTMLAESKCNALLFSVTTASLAIKRPQIVLNVTDLLLTPLSQLDEAEKIKPIDEADERTTAFIVFTSGSTGIPKGVKVHHGGIARLFNEPLKMSSFTPGVRSAQFLNIGFDAAQGEVFFALAGGATIVLRGKDPFECIKSVNVLHITPTGLFSLEPKLFPNLSTIFVGSEPLPQILADKWAHRVRLINLYGPTETCCFVTGGIVQPNSRILCGKPLFNTTVFIFDKEMINVPNGVRGEVYVGGISVANGYLNSAAEEKLRFIPDPFTAGEYIFKTGDQGRLLANGELELFGRQDNQVKFHGYRIELDEIDKAIQAFTDIRGAVSMVKSKATMENKSHIQILVSYISSLNAEESELRNFLSRKLPHYMIPSQFIFMKELPVNSNGKVDRARLKRLALPETAYY
ncbi:hypothetical protein HK100_001422, partial [Physocladia obscura]